MREFRNSRDQARGLDGGGGWQSEAGQQTPEEQATARVFRVRQDSESVASRAARLASIGDREAWRAERTALESKRVELAGKVTSLAVDAATCDTAREHHDAAKAKLDDIATALETAEPRAKPPVTGEVDIEPSILDRSAPPDDVLAWAARLSGRERSALGGRLSAAGGAARDDEFAVALANYLGKTRMLSPFRGVLADPRRFNSAAYERARAATPTGDEGAVVDSGEAGAESGEVGGAEVGGAEVGGALPAGDTAQPVPHQAAMEQSFGADFSGVRVRTGASELRVHGAEAVTRGNEIAFADAQPSPGLTAHELTHVVQQERAGDTAVAASGTVSDATAPAEREANAVGAAVERGEPASSIPITASPSATFHLSPAATGTTAGLADVSTAEANHVEAEGEIRALLNQPIASREIPRLQRRKAALLSLFAAIPSNERQILKRRLGDRHDELGRLFQYELSTKLRQDLLATLDGAVIPAPTGADSVEMVAFATTVNADRFLLAPSEVVLDDSWRTSQPVTVAALPGYGPPSDDAAPQLQWRLVDRMGEVVEQGASTWPVASIVPPPFQVMITAAGRWEIRIEMVDQGKVIAQANKTLMARGAKEDGSDLPGLLAGQGHGEMMHSTQAMSNAELQGQIGQVRAQLGSYDLGGRDKEDGAEVQTLRDALRELEFEGSQRTVDGTPLVTGPDPNELPLDVYDIEAAYDEPDMTTGNPYWENRTAGPEERANLQRRLDNLIATRGLAGARAWIDNIEQELAADEEESSGLDFSDVHTWLMAEWESRLQEAGGMFALTEAGEPIVGGSPNAFEMTGIAIAQGLLGESKGRVQAELNRYGLKPERADMYNIGGNGFEAGADPAALQDAIEQARLIMAALDRYRSLDSGAATSEEVDAAYQEFEAQKTIAMAEHPMLRPFIEGNTRLSQWQPGGGAGIVTGGGLEVSDMQPAHFAQHMGWELNRKLADIDETLTNIADGKLTIFSAPKVVELTRQQMRIAPGTMLDGVLRERVAQGSSQGSDWTDTALALLTLGLGILLAIPTGGTSAVGAAAVVAGEATILIADLYMMGKDMA